MNRSEAAQALAVAQAHDNRSVGEANVMAWADALDDLRLADVVEAIKAHYRAETGFLMPAQIRVIVKRLRKDRLDHAPVLPAPPAELADEPLAQIAWHREQIRRIADGEPIEAEPALTERPVRQLLAGAFRADAS